MSITSISREVATSGKDGFVVEAPWDQVAEIMQWCKENAGARWETSFMPQITSPKGQVAYLFEFGDERDAIFFKMMWHGSGLPQVA